MIAFERIASRRSESKGDAGPAAARAVFPLASALALIAGAALASSCNVIKAPSDPQQSPPLVINQRLPEPTAAPAPVPAREAPAPAREAPPAAIAVRGVSDDEVVFGIVAPLTGAAKELGLQMKTGIETAFNAANDGGGINGRRMRLVAYDDGYEPARTLVGMKQLVTKERAFGIIGNVGTPTAAVALPYALDHKMLFFGAFTGANLLRRDPPDRYVFNVRASYAEETAAVARYLIKVRHLRPEQIAVFAQDDAFGDAGYAGVTKALRTMNAEVGSLVRVGYKRNTIDVTDAVARLRSKSLRAVVMVATYRAAAQFIQRVSDSHPGLIFTNVSFVGSTALAEELKLLGPGVGTGVIVTQVVPSVESHATAILKYKAALARYFPGTPVDYVSLEGYVTASVLLEAMRKVGRDFDSEQLVDEIEKIKGLDLGIGTTISFGPNEHQGSHRVWGTRLDSQGRYETFDLD